MSGAVPNYKTNTVSGTRGTMPAQPQTVSVVVDAAPAERIVRTSTGLREVLFDQIERLRNGKCTVNEAKAVASLAKSIVDTVHMEIAVAEARDGVTGNPVLPPALRLDDVTK